MDCTTQFTMSFLDKESSCPWFCLRPSFAAVSSCPYTSQWHGIQQKLVLVEAGSFFRMYGSLELPRSSAANTLALSVKITLGFLEIVAVSVAVIMTSA